MAIVGMLGLGELPKFTVKKEHSWNPGDSPNSGFANEKKRNVQQIFLQFVLLLKADCYSQQNAEFGS